MDRSGWSEYLKKQRLQDLKALAKQLGIYIKSNTKKGDCIEIILNKALDILIESYNLNGNLKDIPSLKQQQNSILLQQTRLNEKIDESTNLNTVEISEYLYSASKNNLNSICSMCHQVLSENDITCDVCFRLFHHRCVGYDDEKTELNKSQLMVFLENISKKDHKSNVSINSIKFVCPFCRFFILDPYNKIIKPLFFTTVYSYTAIHNIHPKYGNINFSNSSHLPQFTSKFTFSPTTIIGDYSSKQENLGDDRLMIYCLRLDRMDLNHEYPRLLCIKANNKLVQNIESPSYDHIRRDCPIDLSDFMNINQLFNKPTVNITFNTINALICENSNNSLLPIPTAPFIIGLFHTQSISSEKIINWLISEKSLSFYVSKINFKNIIENKSPLIIENLKQDEDSSDEIICLNESQSLNTLCPLTMDTIEFPGRGYYCHHINCFDVKAFIQINSTIKAFNTRWKCPICYQIIRPSMLIIDNFVKKLITDEKIPKENNKITINSQILSRVDSIENEFEISTSKENRSPEKANFDELTPSNLRNKTGNISEKEDLNDSSINPTNSLSNSYLNKEKIEIINISDDEEENAIIEDNFTINEEDLNLLLTKTMNEEKIIEDPCSEYILKTLTIQNSDKTETIFSEMKKKRKVSITSPSSNSSNPSIISPNYDKTSLSLRL